MLCNDRPNRKRRRRRRRGKRTQKHLCCTADIPRSFISRDDPAWQAWRRSLAEEMKALIEPEPEPEVPPIAVIEKEADDLAELGELVMSARMASFARAMRARFKGGEVPSPEQLRLLHKLFAERFGTRRERGAVA